jgi:hypothetical protein
MIFAIKGRQKSHAWAPLRIKALHVEIWLDVFPICFFI